MDQDNNSFINAIVKGDWHKTLSKLGKQGTKDLLHVVLRIEQCRDFEKK